MDIQECIHHVVELSIPVSNVETVTKYPTPIRISHSVRAILDKFLDIGKYIEKRSPENKVCRTYFIYDVAFLEELPVRSCDCN